MYYSSSKYRPMNVLLRIGTFALLFLPAACEQAFESSLENLQPKLLAPANNLASADTTHTFYWEVLPGAASYQLQVVSPRFDSIARLAFDTTVTSNQIPLRLRSGDYQWRVRASNRGTVSAYSDTFRLTIQ